jgi:Zn-dependent protease
MNDTVRLGRLMGVPIGLHWSLVAVVGFFGFELSETTFPGRAAGYAHVFYITAGGLTAIALLAGVLLHELGHAVVARRAGLEVEGITLSWMGGVTRIAGDSPSPWRELTVAGVGPLVSLAVGGVLIGCREAALGLGAGRLPVFALTWLAVINIVLALFNLIPAAPLDGGRILHALVWAVTRNRWWASRTASRAGTGLAALVVALAVYEVLDRGDRIDGLFLLALAWWLWSANREEERQATVQHVLGGVRVYQIMRPVHAAPGWINLDELLSQYVAHRDPASVWLLERWSGGYSGVVSSEALLAIPPPRGSIRPEEVAIAVEDAAPATPYEDILAALERTGGHQVLLVVEAGRTVGAVLPADIEALVRSRRRPTVAAPVTAGVQ